MSTKLIISFIIFIGSIIVLIVVKKKERMDRVKEAEEKKHIKKKTLEHPKSSILEVTQGNEALQKIHQTFNKPNQGLVIPIGLVSDEKLKEIDFQDENNILVIGTTGGGKSICLENIIFSLAMHYSKEEIDIVTMDTSLVELSSFNKIPQYLKDSLSIPQDIVSELSILQKEADKRVHNPSMKKLIVIIDDLYDVCTYDKSVIKTLEYLLRISKEANMYFILATDTPTKEIITESIKENLEETIYLQLSPGEEKDLPLPNQLDEKELDYINDIGFAICKKKDSTEKVEIVDVSDKDIKILKDWFIENR